MGLGGRLATVVKAKFSRLLDRAEDPREVLDLSYQRQLEMLQKMRRGVADVATSRKRVELQIQQLEQAVDRLERQAREALAHGREDLAREALNRRGAAQGELGQLETQQGHLEQQEQKLIVASRRLESKVAAFRTRKETMKASYTAAEAQTEVTEAVTGLSEEMGDVGLAMQRAEDRVQQLQARAAAVDELMASGALDDAALPGGDHIQAELDRFSATSDVEVELERLKGELAAGEAPAQLEAGQDQRSDRRSGQQS